MIIFYIVSFHTEEKGKGESGGQLCSKIGEYKEEQER